PRDDHGRIRWIRLNDQVLGSAPAFVGAAAGGGVQARTGVVEEELVRGGEEGGGGEAAVAEGTGGVAVVGGGGARRGLRTVRVHGGAAHLVGQGAGEEAGGASGFQAGQVDAFSAGEGLQVGGGGEDVLDLLGEGGAVVGQEVPRGGALRALAQAEMLAGEE